MSSAAEQLEVLKEIFTENFEVKDAGRRGGGNTALFEVTSIEGVSVPRDLTVIVNFDDGKKLIWTDPKSPSYPFERVDTCFKGNLNVFVMRRKKVLRQVHQTFNQETFAEKTNTYSLRKILDEVKRDRL